MLFPSFWNWALDHYVREYRLTEGQKLRAYQLIELIAQLRGTVSLGAISCFDDEYFKQYARQ